VMYHMDAVGSGLFGMIFRLYRALLLKPILFSANVVLTASRDYLASSQAAFIARQARVRETPFGVDVARFHPGAARGRNEVLFVGGLDRAHYFKGIHVLLEAFARVAQEHPEAVLLIVGDGDLRAEYEARAASLGDRVRFIGRVPDADLPDLYRSAAVHVLPSIDRSEAFGLVTLEAAASGVPSIVSDLPGVRAVVEPGVTGLRVPPGAAAALSDAILTLLKDPARAETMGRAARDRAERLYARDKAARAVVEALTR